MSELLFDCTQEAISLLILLVQLRLESYSSALQQLRDVKEIEKAYMPTIILR